MGRPSNRNTGEDLYAAALGFARGRYAVRLASGADDIARAQALRHLCFHAREGLDRDEFDPSCLHVLIEERAGGRLVGCFRLRAFRDGSEAGQSYAARSYDLSGLAQYRQPMVEMGRFCIHPDMYDADVLRLAWGALTVFVDRNGMGMLFGCASFPGTDGQEHGETFAALKARHLGPERWRPGVKAREVVHFPEGSQGAPDAKMAHRGMPPLLRSYLTMGGWVGDHAVVDRHLNTLHVFTAVEIDRIPPARKRLLRAVSG
ncbi:ornithine-acyl-ACP acyltransferase [Roseivivax halodurans JCM 10272]|uniref:L-ornithine N(alpha)-acyltransferase n=1 Tax=Roseivivax halodurans JCM 10272 TaxID=1449350 RepID=X7EF91_9RHOB|nr:GNAT family N-acyltransferase [Roseivivax halodurans]ETX14607.1 ornithine-acyl-ACP acyltransferase [Roseivivax halodurans JCM 10272]